MAYQTSYPNVGCGDTGLDQVILRRFDTDTTSCLSLSTGGAVSNKGNQLNAMSGTGDVVAFVSAATNLVSGDTNGTYDVFLRQISTNTTTRITLPGGVQSNGDSQSPSLSATGRYVSFSSSATNLVADDDNGTRDVFRLDRQTGTIERVSVSTAGVEGNGYSSSSTITPDGRFVAAEARRRLLGRLVDLHARDLPGRERAGIRVTRRVGSQRSKASCSR